METIIKKAIEGGYKPKYKNSIAYSRGPIDEQFTVIDPLFWQALGKACGWEIHKEKYLYRQKEDVPWANIKDGDIQEGEHCKEGWFHHALLFHEINLTQGWDRAVEYLSDLVSSK